MLRNIDTMDNLFVDNLYEDLPINPKTGHKRILSDNHGVVEIVDIVLGKYYFVRTLYTSHKHTKVVVYMRDEFVPFQEIFSMSYAEVNAVGERAWLKIQNEGLKKILAIEAQEVKTTVVIPSKATEC